MTEGWALLRLAGAFLTRFPVANGVAFSDERLARSMGLFPAVGLCLGLLLTVSDRLLGSLLPAGVADGLLLLILIWSSGALHLDGLADSVDGLAGGGDRESTLRIMKDSRIGAMGAVALVLVILLKYLSLTHIPPAQKSAALLLMPTAGRWVQVFLARCSTYLRREGTGALFVDRVGSRELLLASATLVVATLLLFSFKGILLLAGLLLFSALLLHACERRLGGVTGDLLGAATELLELGCLLLILMLY